MKQEAEQTPSTRLDSILKDSTMQNENQADSTLTGFFQDFIKKHAVVGAGEGEVELDITPEECEMVGDQMRRIADMLREEQDAS